MKLEIKKFAPAVSEAEVLRVEKKWEFTLPQEYRSFLLLHNGGKPTFDRFKFRQGSYGRSMVDWFLAIYEGKYDNFEDYFDVYKIREPRLLNNLVPIAHDPGGNLICISVLGEDRGAVYFWDHEEEQDEATSENVYLIADTFNEFLQKLEPASSS